MSKTILEKIEQTKIEIQQHENELKRLQQLKKETDRKARTKRLIERGAIMESMIPDADVLTNEQIKTFLEKTITSSYAVKILTEFSAQAITVTDDKPESSKATSEVA